MRALKNKRAQLYKLVKPSVVLIERFMKLMPNKTSWVEYV